MAFSSPRTGKFAGTLILALILPILAACGGTSTTPAASTPAAPSVAASVAAPSVEASAEAPSAEASAEASAAAGEGPTAAESPINDKVIIVGMEQEPDTFFAYESNALATTEVVSPLGDCVTTLDYDYQATYCFDDFPTFENGGAVTETVQIDAAQISEDSPIEVAGQLITDTTTAEAAGIEIPSELAQLTLTWKLAENLYWDDGEQVTAEDVVESFRIQQDPATLLATRQLIDATASLEAQDDFTVVQTMIPGYLDSTYFVDPWMSFAPAHKYNGMSIEEVRAAEQAQPSAFGPFMFQEHEPGVQTTLVSNPYFPTQPKVGTLIFKYVADTNQLLAQLETGEIDMPSPTSLTLSLVPQLDELQANEKATITYVPGTVWEHLDFGIQRGDGQPSFFDDVRIRQAVAYAINRQQIVDDVQYGKTTVMNTIVPEDHPAFPSSGLEEYNYDPEQAKQLLDEAGATDSNGDGIREYKDRPMSMTFYTTSGNATRQAVAEIIQQNLGEVGMEIKLEFVPGPEKLFKNGPDGILTPRLFDLGMYAWLTGVEPSFALYYCDQIPSDANSYDGQNYPGYCNPEYDSAGKAVEQILDADERNQQAAEPLTIINRDLPTFPLYQRLKIGATSPRIQNVEPNATENTITYNTWEWDITE